MHVFSIKQILFCIKNVEISQNKCLSTAIKLIKYNLTDESIFEILWNHNSKEQLHYCKSNPVKLTFRSKYM
jgi:hypothetical protein